MTQLNNLHSGPTTARPKTTRWSVSRCLTLGGSFTSLKLRVEAWMNKSTLELLQQILRNILQRCLRYDKRSPTLLEIDIVSLKAGQVKSKNELILI